MRIFGLTITREADARVIKAAGAELITHLPQTTTSLRGWYSIAGVREAFAGAWQRNITVDHHSVVGYSTVWACITLIASDIAKLWVKLVEEDADGVCTATTNPAYSPVLRKPNAYSTRVKFFEHWIISKLMFGNTFVLKERHGSGVVRALHILNPGRVQVLQAPDGEVLYQLGGDRLAGVFVDSLVVPASEIIHDICVPLFHPLIGVSPIFACGMVATQGLKILDTTMRLFQNGSRPGGILTTPNPISPEQQEILKAYWQANYAGPDNAGKVVLLDNGLKFDTMAQNAVDSEVIAQPKLTDERICATFHVPGYMVGIGPPPPYTDIQSINLQYYTQALQNPIENIETLLEEGLEMNRPYHVEMDLKALLRMDTKTQMETAAAGVHGTIFTTNEARADFDLKPKPGGDQPYMQEQNWPLRQLAARATPTAKPTPPPPAAPTDPAPPAGAAPKGLAEVLLRKLADVDWTDVAA